MPAIAAQHAADPNAKAEHRVPLLLCLLPIAVVVMLLIVISRLPDGKLHVWVLDVGQGDAILVRTPQGHTALIDGGPAATPLLSEMGQHLPFWQRDIDLVVLTHPHQDHLMGLIDVVERYDVEQVAQAHFTATGGVEGQWLRTVRAKGVPVHHPRRGEAISFEGEPEIELRVLSPVSPELSTSGQDEVNNASVVLRLTYGKHDILLEGDAQAEAERELVALEQGYLASEVLKVAHHGSDTSSSTGFIDQVRPRVAIISSGADNKFGHPSARTLSTLSASGVTILRTDLNGTIELIADQEMLWARSER